MSESVIIDHKYHRMVKESESYLRDHKEDSDRAWDFHDGNQFTEKELAQLKDRDQTDICVNICSTLIRHFQSLERARKTNYKAIGVEKGDDDLATAITILLNRVFKNNSFEHTVSEMGFNGAITGISWAEVSVKEDLDRKEDIVSIDLRPWEEMFYDPYSRKPVKEDARYVGRKIWMDRDRVIETWPEKKEEIEAEFSEQHFTEFHGLESEVRSNGDMSLYFDSDTENKGRRICVYDLYYTDPKGRMHYVVFSSNVFLEGSLEDPEKTGDTKKDEAAMEKHNPSPFKHNCFPYIPFIASVDKVGRPVSILKSIIPIQEGINKIISKYIWNISGNRLIHESNALVYPDLVRKEMNRPNGVIEVHEGKLTAGAVRIDKNLEESAHLLNILQWFVEMAQRITGLNDASLGFGGVNARSALQEDIRTRQGASQQASILDNLFFSKKRIAEVVTKTLPEVYDKERTVRVVGVDLSETVIGLNTKDDSGQIVNDISKALAYDIELKEESIFNTAREETSKTLVELMKTLTFLAPALSIPLVETLNIQNKDDVLKIIQDAFEQNSTTSEAQSAGLRLA